MLSTSRYISSWVGLNYCLRIRQITNIALSLRYALRVRYIAPVHCTGELAFAILKETFDDHYVYAGLGTTVYWDQSYGESRSRTAQQKNDG